MSRILAIGAKARVDVELGGDHPSVEVELPRPRVLELGLAPGTRVMVAAQSGRIFDTA